MLAEVIGVKRPEDFRLDLVVIAPVAAQEQEVMDWAPQNLTAPYVIYVLRHMPGRAAAPWGRRTTSA